MIGKIALLDDELHWLAKKIRKLDLAVAIVEDAKGTHQDVSQQTLNRLEEDIEIYRQHSSNAFWDLHNDRHRFREEKPPGEYKQQTEWDWLNGRWNEIDMKLIDCERQYKQLF